jgi:hypothetical protein
MVPKDAIYIDMIFLDIPLENAYLKLLQSFFMEASPQFFNNNILWFLKNEMQISLVISNFASWIQLDLGVKIQHLILIKQVSCNFG